MDLFDESSADNTGHVLAALGAYGLTLGSSRAVTRATRFLRRTQDPGTGLWEGRWGINTLYGTTQAGTGLLRAGESPQAPYLQQGRPDADEFSECRWRLWRIDAVLPR